MGWWRTPKANDPLHVQLKWIRRMTFVCLWMNVGLFCVMVSHENWTGAVQGLVMALVVVVALIWQRKTIRRADRL